MSRIVIFDMKVIRKGFDWKSFKYPFIGSEQYTITNKNTLHNTLSEKSFNFEDPEQSSVQFYTIRPSIYPPRNLRWS